MNALHRALVISTGKNIAWVVLDNESAPRIAQLRRASGKRSMPVPGDVVFVRILEDERTLIDRIESRVSVLERHTNAGRSKIVAANVDTLVTVTALANPAPRLITLDQLLAFAELQGIDAVVAFTKPDLSEPIERDRLTALYASLGYTTLVLNPRAHENVEGLRTILVGLRALLCGVSGVGKSTIFSALGGTAGVGAVSRFGMGRQTTTSARLFRRADGFLIDSPGVNEFGLGRMSASELVHGFREMLEPARNCRFSDCQHLEEPECCVKQAVTDGRVAATRYASFRKILAGTA